MTHNDVWYAIDIFAKEHKMTCSGLAKYSGLDMAYNPDFPEQQEPQLIREPFERRGIRVDIL